jgi:hypothetical protein
MQAPKATIEEIVRFWQSKGVPPCAEAQADGVPCPTIGRACETCATALRALEDARGSLVAPRPEVLR